MIWRLLSLLSIPLVAFAFYGIIRQVRKPQRLRRFTPIVGIVMSTLMLVVNVVFLRRANPGLWGLALLAVGLGFGVTWGEATHVERTDETVVANRSVMHLVFWAVSFGVTQVLATFASTTWVAGGVLAMFFAAGTTLGSNASLLRQLRNVVSAPPEPARVGP